MSRNRNPQNQDWPARVLEIGWLLAATAVPFVFNPWGSSAFELPKTALLRALVLLMGVAALAQAVAGRRQQTHGPTISLLVPALLLGGATLLATVLSTNPHVSFWGSYERQQGLLTQGAYLALFLLTAANLRSREQVDRLWRTIVWGSAPVTIYGLLQAAGLDPISWHTTGASPVLSTAGRSNFFGSYLVIVVPLTVARLFQTRRRWPHALLLLGQLTCLALTQARGAWVGTGATLVAGLLAWSVARRSWRPLLIALGTAALGVILVALLNTPDGPLAPLARLPSLDRLAHLTRTDAGSAGARVTVWRATLPLLLSRPWLGYGPETMRAVFARVFPPELVFLEGRHVSIDRAHNLWLDLGMSTGMVGVLAFGALVIGAGRLIWRGLRQAPDRHDQITWAALAAATGGHLVDMQFSFDLTASATAFWLVLALVASRGRAPLPPARQRSRNLGRGWFAVIPVSLAALAFIAAICLRPLAADVSYWRSQHPGRPAAERVEASIQAVRLWPLEPVYRLGLTWYLVRAGDMPMAQSQMVAATRQAPDSPRVWTAWGDLYMAWGEQDSARFMQAEQAYRKLLTLAPNTARYHMALGLALAKQSRMAEGLAATQYAAALDETDPAIYDQLANIYWEMDRYDEAAQARATCDQLLAWERGK